MTPRGQLEATIADALSRMSPENMQRVAEDYARIRFRSRFPHFSFRAFSEEGKSRSGWPDAWIDVEGRIDGVEATVAKDKARVVEHLKQDLEKAKKRNPKLAGLVLVSGHPAVQLTHDELASWSKHFANEAGIAADCINIIFGPGLVGELACPEFARTRREVLGLRVAPNYFKLVVSKRGPDEPRLVEYVPSEEDYDRGRVHWPAAADRVIEVLNRVGCALVRGVGASGKSVLAWLIALKAAEERRPSYLLDLAHYIDATPDIRNALLEDLHCFSHPEVLFEMDNCHLNESLAKDVVLAWRKLAEKQRPPRLLLLGRELQTARGSLIDGLNITPLVLRSRQPEVRGVYRRLAWRKTGDQAPPEPPPQVLDDWVQVFGGDPRRPDTTTDLIAFSAAVRGRIADLVKERWTLSEADAAQEMRSVYLNNLCEGETLNLKRLCVMEELEIGLSEDGLADRRAGFDRCSRHHGLVFRQATEVSQDHYRLAHAALGRLILEASYGQVNTTAERVAIVLQDPSLAGVTVDRLVTLGRWDEVSQLFSELIDRGACRLAGVGGD